MNQTKCKCKEYKFESLQELGLGSYFYGINQIVLILLSIEKCLIILYQFYTYAVNLISVSEPLNMQHMCAKI